MNHEDSTGEAVAAECMDRMLKSLQRLNPQQDQTHVFHLRTVVSQFTQWVNPLYNHWMLISMPTAQTLRLV
jgi:hypothetical protein